MAYAFFNPYCQVDHGKTALCSEATMAGPVPIVRTARNVSIWRDGGGCTSGWYRWHVLGNSSDRNPHTEKGKKKNKIK
ncbi:hypothetical protein CEXT_730041 [Caerostris extrusa]|uniref:Uncharacterized protein n=1 Tax=Caerostris extrusa TaxID=172846 RepID=A0AAV4QIH6_CAEEX|nr:hypothetical protein CEXT_730041 [Caerostris extrusa]